MNLKSRTLDNTAIKRVALKKKPAFVSDDKYQKDALYADAVPLSRWHNIEAVWNGKRYRFQMSINEFCAPAIDIRLGHVFEADASADEWIAVSRVTLEAARADIELMASLNRQVGVIEAQRQDGFVGDDFSDTSSDEALE